MDKESALFYVVLLLFAVTGIVTILGLVQKVSIERKYLNALFSSLILELIAAVLYLFSNANFFDHGGSPEELVVLRTELPPAHQAITADAMLTLVQTHDADQPELERLQREITLLGETLGNQLPPYDDVMLALNARIREIETLRSRNDALLARQQAHQKLEKQFLVRMARFNTLLAEFGTSINLGWKPEDKREIAGMLQEAFKQIRFMPADETPDDDPARALELLVEYQLSKNFGETGFLTTEVVAFIIRDYLVPVSINGNNTGP